MKMQHGLGYCFLTVAAALLGAVASAAEISVGAGETHTLTAEENVTTTVFKLADTATLAVPSGISWLNCSIDVTSGMATLDVAAVAGTVGMGAYKPTYLRTLGGDGSKLVVKGKDALSFGKQTQSNGGTINLPSFDADVSFVDAGGVAYESPVGVTFVNNVLIRRVPTSSPYMIANGTIVALGGTNPLGLTSELRLTDWDLEGPIHPEGGMPYDSAGNPVIIVAPGRTFNVRSGTTTDGTTTWGRWNGKVRNDVTVNGSMLLYSPWSSSAGGDITFSGDVNGSGIIEGKDATATIAFDGSFDFDGELRCGTVRQITFRNRARVGTLTAASSTTIVMKNDLSVGALAGDLVLTAASTGTLHVGTLAAGATISIPESVKLRIDNAVDSAATVTLSGETGTYSVAGPTNAAAAAVAFDLTYPEGDVNIALGGKIATGAFPQNVRSVSLDADCEWTPPAAYANWQDKLSLWLDASVDSSFVYADDYDRFHGQLENPYRGSDPTKPLVYQWKDCRLGHETTYTRTKRIGTSDTSTYKSNGKNLMLARSTNTTVNASGLPYVDSAAYMAHAQIAGDSSTVAAQYFIVVFGSQNGGGRAVLGNQQGAFARSAQGTTAAHATRYSIATNAFETYVDGSSVDPTVATFNGGWQIISMKTDGNSVQGLGFGSNGSSDTPSDRGYCNYAEVLVFSELLTENERKTAEKYLADKWDISISHDGVPPMAQELTLSGTGTITLSADTTVHGTFSGDINVNGFTLTVADDGNLREATPHGTGIIAASQYRQLPKEEKRAGFTGTMTPPPPGFKLIFR